MNDLLLLTRVTPPRLPACHIERERVGEQIDAAIDRDTGVPGRLTVICAPAGYGKSTALAAAAARRDGRFAYLRVDSSENEPVRFWSYVAEALHSVYTGVGERSRALLSNATIAGALGGDSVETPFLTSLLNEITSYADPVVLAIDDYHAIETEEVHSRLARFIAELPPNAHVIVASRCEPPLQLSRLRARGELHEIGAHDLAFTGEQTAHFFDQRLGKTVGAGIDFERVQRSLEGWPAGLHMAALSAEHSTPISEALGEGGVGNRYIVEFLTDEIIAGQSESIRSFLLETSILRYLSPTICSRLCAREVSREEIDDLVRRGLFVVRESGSGGWYRYHHLFADLLRSRLDAERGPEAVRALHHAAARAFSDEGVPTEALEHAFAAGDNAFAAEVLETYAFDLLNEGRHAHIIGYLARLPDTRIEASPQLAVASALTLTVGGHLDRAGEMLAHAKQTADSLGDGAPLIHGIIATVEGFSAVFRNDIEATRERSETALATLPRTASVWRMVATMASGDSSFLRGRLDEAFGAYSIVVSAARRGRHHFFLMLTALRLLRLGAYRGRLQRMDSLAREFLEEVKHNGFAGTAREGQIWGLYSRVAREQLKLDAALERAKRACELAEGHPSLLVFGLSRQWLAGAHFARGELEECRDVLDEADEGLAGHSIPNITMLLLAWRLRVELALAEREGTAAFRALELAAAHDLDESSEPNVLHERALFALVRIYRYSGEPGKAGKLLDRLQPFCDSAQLMPAAMEARLLRCQLSEDRGDRPAALSDLALAVRELTPEGYLYPFAAEGPQLTRLLYALLRSPGAPKATGPLLSALSAASQGAAGEGASPPSEQPTLSHSPIIEPLSDREIDVLRLISEGLSNRQIAERLFVSLNTVKWHTGNIYGKLGVEGRTGAITRSRELGVLGA